jgi:hypothetical protein
MVIVMTGALHHVEGRGHRDDGRSSSLGRSMVIAWNVGGHRLEGRWSSSGRLLVIVWKVAGHRPTMVAALLDDAAVPGCAEVANPPKIEQPFP